MKNTRGLVVKLVDKDGLVYADCYYSYPSGRPAGEMEFSIGKVRFHTTRQVVKRLAEYVLGGVIPAVSKSSATPWKDKKWLAAQMRACINAISTVRQVKAAKKQVNKARRASLRLKTLHTATVVICYLLGIFLVQAGCLWFYGELALTFMAFFFCVFVGMVLNFAVTEIVFPIVIRGYHQKLKFGESGHGGNLFIMSYGTNLALYLISFFFVELTALKAIELLMGIIFTFYSMNYLVNIMFAMKHHVMNINAGKTALNVRHYSNTALPPVRDADMPPVTISLTVYTEENSVIFNTMREGMAAIEDYKTKCGRPANLVVSDDGFFKFLNGIVNAEMVEHYLKRKQDDDPTLTKKELMILERIAFYRQNNIAFVARPMPERPGKFKKGGNLNYTNKVAQRLAEGCSREELLAVGGEFYGGYFEGDVSIHDIILVLDKDSGVAPGVLHATVPEFINDPKLAYTQHKTVSANLGVNYFTRGMSAFLNTLFSTHLPNKALQGLTVPLMGHNAFVRRSFIEESGGWAENRVAEDFSKSLDAYRLGCHGKYIAHSGLEFSEHVCQTFAEETEKQYRYCYGLMEMVFKDFKEHVSHYFLNRPYKNPKLQKLKAFQIFDILTYFLSYVNLAACIPVVIFIVSGTYINILYGGIIINLAVYYFCPALQSLMFRLRSKGPHTRASLFNYAVINFNFFGHSYSMLKGIISLAVDCVRNSYEPFATSNVDYIEKSFSNGIRTIGRFYAKNYLYTIASLVFAVKGITLLMSGETALTVIVPALYLISFLFPILLLTPQLFSLPFQARKVSKDGQVEVPELSE